MPEISQRELWNGKSGERWAEYQEDLDRSLSPLDAAGLARAAPASGEHVVDIGCGCGASSIALGDRVGKGGSVLGLDISKPMLERARMRTVGRPQITLREADAATYAFDGTADLVYSRFGVMFFDDPEAAFANLKRALRPDGRITFVCWRSPAENPWFEVPIRAAATVMKPLPPSPPGAPGPFAFADADRVKRILAPFVNVAIEPYDHELSLSTNGLDAAVSFSLRAGPASRILVDANDDERARVKDAVARALSEHLRGESVTLPSAVWIVSARAPRA